jgi:hypothetical protein
MQSGRLPERLLGRRRRPKRETRTAVRQIGASDDHCAFRRDRGRLLDRRAIELAIARCDLDLTLSYKNTTFNFAKHRQPQAYTLIVERKGAIPPPGVRCVKSATTFRR